MYIIGVTGLSCSGKSTLSKKLQEKLGSENCLSICMDNYYKELTPEQYEILHNDEAAINFDTPDQINFNLMKKNISDIKNNNPDVQIPNFDLASCLITSWTHVPQNKLKYLIIEGVFIFSDPDLANLCNLKVWVETSEYVCALRRFIKFTSLIKGYTSEYIYNQCVKFVIPGQEKYVKPQKKCCDFFINGENDSINYVDMIVSFVNTHYC
jgi:uridine kinase